MMNANEKTDKNEFVVKFGKKTTKLRFLQNINYDKMGKKGIDELNPNYVIHKLLFRSSDVKKVDTISLRLGYLKKEKSKFSYYPSLSQKTPKEIENYFDTVKDYCDGMDLELISEDLNIKKMVIGLGNPSVLETSITLHHIYGMPYLPGQALKGVFRRYFFDEIMEGKSETKIGLKGEKPIEKKVLYRNLFGEDPDSQEKKNKELQKSGIVFFDAFPIKAYKLEKDIINTHYKSYYDGDKKEFPDGTEEPNLINFYVVKDTKFKVMCALNRKVFGENNLPKIKKYIVETLIDALKEQGIGAKTTSDYGYIG